MYSNSKFDWPPLIWWQVITIRHLLQWPVKLAATYVMTSQIAPLGNIAITQNSPLIMWRLVSLPILDILQQQRLKNKKLQQGDSNRAFNMAVSQTLPLNIWWYIKSRCYIL
jgi:hypothetical protein